MTDLANYDQKLRAKALRRWRKDLLNPAIRRALPGRGQSPGVAPGVVMALNRKPGDLIMGPIDQQVKTESGIIAALETVDRRIEQLESARADFELSKTAHLRKRKAGEVPPFIAKKDRRHPDTEWIHQRELNAMLRRRNDLNNELKAVIDTHRSPDAGKPYSSTLTHLIRAEHRLDRLIQALPVRFAGNEYRDTEERLKNHLLALRTKISLLSSTHQPDAAVELEAA